MSEAQPSILITGANGFIGSRLSGTFLDHGYTVFAGVRKTADLSLLRRLPVTYRFGDVCKPETLPAMVALLKRDPQAWYEMNNLPLPEELQSQDAARVGTRG